MVTIIDKKQVGAAVFDEKRRERHHSATLSSSSSGSNTLYSVPTSSTFKSVAPVLDGTTSNAESASNAEQSMTLREGLRLYPKAIIWSVLLSMTLIMEGYSTILVPNLYALDPFRKQFGDRRPNGLYEISAIWQSALVNGGLGGQILGLFATGTLSERIGYRYTLMLGLVAMTLFIFVPFFATSKAVLLIGQCLLGVPWGVFQCISTVYAADVCPVALRAYLTTYVNACWVLGQLIASIVLRGMVSNSTTWSYRIPFAIQWVFPLPIFVAVYFAPESPWWLIRQNRFVDAKISLRRLRTKSKEQPEEEFAASLGGTMETMIQTNEREQSMQSGTSYKDCFKGVDRRRTEITCMVWIIQTLCGSTFMGFSTYFYEQAGLGSSHAFTLSLAQFTLGLLGVLVSWALMSRFGRRTLYLSGQALTFVFVLLIGILACVPQPNAPSHPDPGTNSTAAATTNVARSADSVNLSPPSSPLNWAIAALLLAFTLSYDATLGPICYSLVSEIPSTRLRSKTIVLARNAYNVSGIITNIVTPRMLNPTAWGWGARAGFFWAGTAVLGMGWSWFRLPEPKGRSFAELDGLFKRGVAARKFKGAVALRISARPRQE
ncbi:sugar transporter [Clathrospora elynae]|uniref:Sugar transporter n=1 Tax=Clathrospora elynae TaxID=706981 RepID=A0A6A5SBE2_9PLEO|nr:sugar transporter [Clathrospora elynae]